MGGNPKIMEEVASVASFKIKMTGVREFVEKDTGSKKNLGLNVCIAGRRRSEALRGMETTALEIAGVIVCRTEALSEHIWRNKGCKWRYCRDCCRQNPEWDNCLRNAYEKAYEALIPAAPTTTGSTWQPTYGCTNSFRAKMDVMKMNWAMWCILDSDQNLHLNLCPDRRKEIGHDLNRHQKIQERYRRKQLRRKDPVTRPKSHEPE